MKIETNFLKLYYFKRCSVELEGLYRWVLWRSKSGKSYIYDFSPEDSQYGLYIRGKRKTWNLESG